jgi:hypothetical protein
MTSGELCRGLFEAQRSKLAAAETTPARLVRTALANETTVISPTVTVGTRFLIVSVIDDVPPKTSENRRCQLMLFLVVTGLPGLDNVLLTSEGELPAVITMRHDEFLDEWRRREQRESCSLHFC